jgi:hypothetical protein
MRTSLSEAERWPVATLAASAAATTTSPPAAGVRPPRRLLPIPPGIGPGLAFRPASPRPAGAPRRGR